MDAACDTGAEEVGDTEVKKDRTVSGQIAWREPDVFSVTLVATMFLKSPRVRAPRREKEARAVFV